MEKIIFDGGLREYEVGGGILSFNPSDPNVYIRFMEATDKLLAIEDNLVNKAKVANGSGEVILQLLRDTDLEAKQVLGWVFGEHNDFDKILNGTNLLAVGTNGERILTNFLQALLPVIKSGAEECAKLKTDAAKAQARAERAQRQG